VSWEENLLDASFRDVVFDCVSTADDVAQALVEHEYPYVDGADVENMGLKARRVQVHAVFFGLDYDTRLQQFIRALEGADSLLSPEQAATGGWLQHPVFGMLFCQVADHKITHQAEDVDEAHVDVNFVVSTPSAPFFSQQLASQKADAAAQHKADAVSSVSDKVAKIIAAVQAANPLNGLDRLRQAVMGPLLDITAGVGMVLSGLDPLQYPRAWANDVAGLAGNILDVRDWTRDVRAQWPSILSDFKSFSLLGTPPAAAVPQLTPYAPPTEDQAIATVAATIQVMVTATIGEAAGIMLASEIATPTLMPVEVEALANTARTQIQAAMDQVRVLFTLEDGGPVCDALRNQALALQQAAAAVIAARPPLVQRSVTVPGNFRLQAHAWYGDSDRAAELYLMNGARSPFTQPGDIVNAYAA